jgi:hypothetical protein
VKRYFIPGRSGGFAVSGFRPGRMGYQSNSFLRDATGLAIMYEDAI